MEQLELLWRLQALDLAIAKLQAEIEHNPLFKDVQEAEEKRSELEAVLDRETEWQAEQRRKLKSMELDLNTITADRAGLRNKLYGGTVSNVRELELMEKRLVSLGTEQEQLEEKIIKLMEEAEEQQVKLGELKKQVERQKQVVQDEESRLQQKLSTLGLQEEQLQEKRAALLPLIESEYRDLYRTQCERHRGKGISRVINDTCEGCRMFISTAQRGLLYNPASLVYCENCGRLLVRLPGEDEGTDT